MNCAEFEHRLGGSPTDPAERAALAAHSSTCPRCSSLLAAMQGRADARTATEREEFVSALLRRTTGSPCARAQSALPAWLDGELGREDSDLMVSHVEHCPGCTALAAALRALRRDLPALASVEPDARFAADVVTTIRALKRPRDNALERLLQGWRRLLVRPRFAWEFATAACSLLALLYTLPSSPLRPVPQRALAVVRVDVVGLAQSAGARFGPAAEELARGAWDGSGGRLHRAAAARAKTFADENEATVAAWRAVRANCAAVGAGIKSRNLAQMSAALQELGGSLGALFRGSTPTAGSAEP